MNGHLLFLVFFLVIFIVGMIVRGYYGRQSPDREKPLRDRLRAAVEHEGQLSFAILMLQAVFMIAAVVLYIFFTPQFSWLSLPFPEWLRWIGVILGLISLPFLWWVQSTLGRSFSPSSTIQEGHLLVTDGTYRRVRHPGYLGQLLFYLGTPLLLGSWWAFFLGILMAIVFVYRTAKEDQALQTELRDYKAYTEQVRTRLVPGIW